MSDPTETNDSPASDEAALAAVLDALIPASAARGLPSAGAAELGLAAYVAGRLGDALALLRPGFDALDARARGLGAARFAALDGGRRTQVLRAYAEEDAGFLPALLFHAYAGYYQSAAVQAALGMEGRPPHPLGYALGPDDERLLDPVRARAPFYRVP